jgi:hypothetical protein
MGLVDGRYLDKAVFLINSRSEIKTQVCLTLQLVFLPPAQTSV